MFPKLHVITRKEDLDASRVGDKVIVVIDVLFATTTIVTAIAAGARQVVPALDAAEARAAAADLVGGAPVLAGEFMARSIEGFGPFAPIALSKLDLGGKTLVYATTNGTVALRNAASAADVYAGALLNCGALAEHLRNHHRHQTILLLCAGSAGRFNLEDFYAAGCLLDELLLGTSCVEGLSDAALAALELSRRMEAESCLLASRVGRMMSERSLLEEVRFSARRNAIPVVARLDNGVLRRC